MKNKKFIVPLLASAFLASCGSPTSSAPSSSHEEHTPPQSSEAIPSTPESTPEQTPSSTPSSSIEKPKKHWNEDGVLKILEIGNSYGEDTFYYAPHALPSFGVNKFVIGKMYIGGCSLDQHFENSQKDTLEKGSYEYRKITDAEVPNWTLKRGTSVAYALNDEEWDFISFQQQSMHATETSKFTKLIPFVDFVEATNRYKDSRYVWNMTWAYPEINEDPRFVEFYKKDHVKMYQDIVKTVKEAVVPEKRFEKILVPGTAVENARTSFLDKHLFRDDLHLSYDTGRYVACLTYFSSLLDKELTQDFAYAPEYLTASEKLVGIESAMNALTHPYQITASAHPTDPEPRFSGVDKTIRLEAEDGVLDGKKAKHVGCENGSGGEIAADINDCGQGLQWIHYAPVASEHTIRIAYWTGMAGSKMTLDVNGQSQTITFTEAKGWADGFNAPSIVEAKITLAKGQNNISLYKHGTGADQPAWGGFAQIDYMDIIGTNATYDVSSLDLQPKAFTLQAERGHFHTGGAPFPCDTMQGGYAVGEINAKGQGVDLSFYAPVSGRYGLQIQYAQGGDKNVVDVKTGGQVISFPLPVYEGQTWNKGTLSTTILELDLKAEERNSISLTRGETSDWFIIDSLHFVPLA